MRGKSLTRWPVIIRLEGSPTAQVIDLMNLVVDFREVGDLPRIRGQRPGRKESSFGKSENCRHLRGIAADATLLLSVAILLSNDQAIGLSAFHPQLARGFLQRRFGIESLTLELAHASDQSLR